MEKANDIIKIRYTISLFDVAAMRSHTRYVYELYPDGKVSFAHYERGNRKPEATDEKHTASASDFMQLVADLNACIETADRDEMYVDDTGAEAIIYRPFGRTDTMDRGYGNGEIDVGQLISNYIYGVGGYRW